MSDNARGQLKDLSKELVRAGEKARRRGKPRDWHRLRTTSRRLRGALVAHAEVLDPARQPRLATRAKKITKLPTGVRDLDVALDNLEVLRALAAGKAQRRAVREMRRRLSRKRDRLDRKLRKRLRRDQPTQELASTLKKALRRQAVPARPGNGVVDVLVVPSRDVRERWAAVADWQDDAAVHALRVAVKKYRGALAALPGLTREQRAALETLQRVQDLLGQHHDWSMLALRLDRRRRKLANRGARHRELVGYEALLARARQEQKARYDGYRGELHVPLGLLVEAITPLEARAQPFRAGAPTARA
jgi:CHAD domain-containing protein